MGRPNLFVAPALLASLALEAAPVRLVFSGIDASAQPARASLLNPATKESAWVAVGGSFAGCEVRAYDAQKQSLTLARGSETWEIALEGIPAAAPALSAEETERITRQVTNNLRQISAASEQYFLEQGVTTVRLDQLVGPDKYIRELKPADGEDYSKLKLEQVPTPVDWVIVTGRGVTVRWTRN